MNRLPCPNNYCLKSQSDIECCSHKNNNMCTKFTVLFTPDNTELALKWLRGECMNSEECQYKLGTNCNRPKGGCCNMPSFCLYRELEG